MLLALPFSFYYESNDHYAIMIAAAITAFVGLIFFKAMHQYSSKDIKKREGFLIVTLGWVVLSLFGTLPYLISGAIPGFTNAFFETVSGFTTTGSSVLNDVESLPEGILIWRSTTQWIGGLGIIVLTIAILPILGIGGMELFIAEAPGPTNDKLHPRIKETAKRLWFIYVSLTALEVVLLMLGGVSFFDAINHAFTTLSSGGFSTKQGSIADFESPFVHYVIIVFMVLAGTNFTIIYFSLKGRIKKVWENDEFKWYICGMGVLILFISAVVYSLYPGSPEEVFRNVMFQVVAIMTTTGYTSFDYTAWTPFLTMLFFILLFTGASAGSTSGGIKFVRHVLLIKNSILEFKRRLHPRAVIPVRMSKMAVDPAIINNVLAFFLLYILIFVFSIIILAFMGLNFITSMGAAATALGNVGPGIGDVGPTDNFHNLPDAAKWFLAFLMLLGRLELFTVLILFTPYYWKRI